MEKNDGGPAFPRAPYDPGMSLRDWFAGQALGHSRCDPWNANPNYWEGLALGVYAAADAMLAARDKL